MLNKMVFMMVYGPHKKWIEYHRLTPGCITQMSRNRVHNIVFPWKTKKPWLNGCPPLTHVMC